LNYAINFTNELEGLLNKAESNFKKAKSMMSSGDRNINRVNKNLKSIINRREYINVLKSIGDYKDKNPPSAFENGFKEKKVIKKTYYESGKLKSLVPYNSKSNLKDGLWKSYYENGQLQYTVLYVNDKEEGEEKLYREDGSLLKILHRHNGKTISADIYNEKQQLIRIIEVIDGKAVVKSTYKYFEHEGYYVENNTNGLIRAFYNDGALLLIGKSKNKKQIGEWKYYDKNGNLVKKETYVDGIKKE